MEILTNMAVGAAFTAGLLMAAWGAGSLFHFATDRESNPDFGERVLSGAFLLVILYALSILGMVLRY